MKVIVKDYLNVRVGKPDVNAPSHQYLAPGSEIEVDGILYQGGFFDNINTWYKDRANNYYWTGGFFDTTTRRPAAYIPGKMSWGHKYYDIPLIWNQLDTTGEGITVAVIDTGVDVNHGDLLSKINHGSRGFLGDEQNITDINGHGTNMAGIIAATGESKVYGVAPGADLLILKAGDHVRGANVKLFAKALDYASGIDTVDVISFSNVFQDDPDLRAAIAKCLLKNKLIISAIGNGRDFVGFPNGPDKDTFPACYENVVAVGAFDSKGQVCAFSNWNPRLSFLAPGDFSVKTTGLNDQAVNGAGTSIATAFTAGCFALLLSYAAGKGISTRECLDAVLSSCDDIGSSIGRDIKSGFGIMNLRNAITKLLNPSI